MKVTTTFTALTAEVKQRLDEELKGVLSEADHNGFVKWVKPYEEFGYRQLDGIYLFAEVTVEGDVEVEELVPNCVVDQEDWYSYDDEPDMQIDPVYIPLKAISPKMPLSLAGKNSFIVVLEAEGNLWDACKELPSWIWNDKCFEFMLSLSLKTKTGKQYDGSTASQTIRWS